MKIFLIIPEVLRSGGGIQVYNNFVIKGLKELGHSVSVLSMNDTDALNKIKFFPAGRYRTLKKPIFVLKMFEELINYKPDLIICGHVNFAYLCMLANKIFNIPYYVFTYGIDVFKMGKIQISGIIHSQKIVTISNFTREAIVKQIKERNINNFFLLPPPFNPERFKPSSKPGYLLERWGIKQDDKVLLTVARLSKVENYKGYDRVLFALSTLFQTPLSFKLKYVIVGSGDDIDRVRTLIKELNLENNVILTGYVSDQELPDYYNLCDVFVMPSKGEGFGIVFVEALACGKPVIAGNRDASKDTLMNGEIGILIDPDNIKELTTAIEKVIKKEVEKKLLEPEYLRKRVTEIYGYDKFKERLKELIKT